MKKSETLALYREAYLEGRGEDERRAFKEKDESRQYAAVMSWKRRQEKATQPKEETASAIIESVRRARKALLALTDLAPRDAERLAEAINELKADCDNFEQIKKGRRLRELRSQRLTLQREIELLESEGITECL